MKVVYLTTGGNSESAGVEKKINNQISVLSRDHEVIRLNVPKSNKSKIFKIFSLLPGGSISRDYEEALANIKSIIPNVVLIRGISFDRKYVSFIRHIKQELRDVKILFEVPTYPYGKELLNNRTMWPWFFKDYFQRNKVSGLIDRVITYSDDDEIFGVQTIRVKNGIDIDSVKFSADYIDTDGSREEIRLLAVAQLQKYHGYDRIIKAIAKYYENGGERNIVFDIVGDGGEKAYLSKITSELKMNNHVIFHGRVVGEELAKFYQRADIGVGSFATYKLGVYKVSNLKVREYLAYGLPVISGCIEDIFEDNKVDFYKGFPNNDTDIDFLEILGFYDGLYNNNNRSELKIRIHNFAKEHADMDVVMRPILKYINEYDNN